MPDAKAVAYESGTGFGVGNLSLPVKKSLSQQAGDSEEQPCPVRDSRRS